MKDWLGLIKKSIYSHTNIRAKGDEKLSATPVAGSSYPTGLRLVLDTYSYPACKLHLQSPTFTLSTRFPLGRVKVALQAG